MASQSYTGNIRTVNCIMCLNSHTAKDTAHKCISYGNLEWQVIDDESETLSDKRPTHISTMLSYCPSTYSARILDTGTPEGPEQMETGNNEHVQASCDELEC
jgi:hypothetical protein